MVRFSFIVLAVVLSVAPMHALGEESPRAERTTIRECATAFSKLVGAIFGKFNRPPAKRLPPWAFIFEPVAGRSMAPEEISKLETQVKGARYSKISDGHHGGPVYRVRPPGEAESFVVKEYRSAAERANDMQAFERLRSEQDLSNSVVQIASSEISGEISMRVQDVQGVDLWNAVWLRKDFSDAAKMQLIGDWNQFVKDVEKRLGPGEFDSHFSDLHGLRRVKFSYVKDGVKINVWLKPENAIVESGTGRIIVVDPH